MAIRRILFAAYGGGHIGMLLPVLDALRDRTDIDCKVLALTTAARAVSDAAYEPLGFHDFIEQGDGPALEIGRRLAAELGGNQIIPLDHTIAYMGLSYRDMIDRHGEVEAARLYAEKGRWYFHPYPTISRILKRIVPDLIVTTNAPRAERALVEAASDQGIPALCLGDLFLDFEWEWCALPGFGDYIGVMSQSVRQHLIEKGRPAEEIVVTGNPAFDCISDTEVIEAGAAIRAAAGWDENPVIMWAMPAIPPGDKRIAPVGPTLAAMKALSERRPDLRFILRPHPNVTENLEGFTDQFRISHRFENVHSVIHASDLVVTEFSTVGLEGALAGKPVISIASKNIIPYEELGITYEIDHAGQLGDAIEHVLANGNATRLDLLGAPEPGEATGNVVRLIDQMLGESR